MIDVDAFIEFSEKFILHALPIALLLKGLSHFLNLLLYADFGFKKPKSTKQYSENGMFANDVEIPQDIYKEYQSKYFSK